MSQTLANEYLKLKISTASSLSDNQTNQLKLQPISQQLLKLETSLLLKLDSLQKQFEKQNHQISAEINQIKKDNVVQSQVIQKLQQDKVKFSSQDSSQQNQYQNVLKQQLDNFILDFNRKLELSRDQSSCQFNQLSQSLQNMLDVDSFMTFKNSIQRQLDQYGEQLQQSRESNDQMNQQIRSLSEVSQQDKEQRQNKLFKIQQKSIIEPIRTAITQLEEQQQLFHKGQSFLLERIDQGSQNTNILMKTLVTKQCLNDTMIPIQTSIDSLQSKIFYTEQSIEQKNNFFSDHIDTSKAYFSNLDQEIVVKTTVLSQMQQQLDTTINIAKNTQLELVDLQEKLQISNSTLVTLEQSSKTTIDHYYNQIRDQQQLINSIQENNIYLSNKFTMFTQELNLKYIQMSSMNEQIDSISLQNKDLAYQQVQQFAILNNQQQLLLSLKEEQDKKSIQFEKLNAYNERKLKKQKIFTAQYLQSSDLPCSKKLNEGDFDQQIKVNNQDWSGIFQAQQLVNTGHCKFDSNFAGNTIKQNLLLSQQQSETNSALINDVIKQFSSLDDHFFNNNQQFNSDYVFRVAQMVLGNAKGLRSILTALEPAYQFKEESLEQLLQNITLLLSQQFRTFNDVFAKLQPVTQKLAEFCKTDGSHLDIDFENVAQLLITLLILQLFGFQVISVPKVIQLKDLTEQAADLFEVAGGEQQTDSIAVLLQPLVSRSRVVRCLARFV